MKPQCPYCSNDQKCPSGKSQVVRNGRYVRTSDGQLIQKYRCKSCERDFSDASFSLCVNQKKREKNMPVFTLLCSGVSLRRSARILNISRTTISRKLIFLGSHVRSTFDRISETNRSRVTEMQFDEMETFEHSKMKMVSIALAVESGSRKILGFEVCSMPCKGRLAKRSREKYGKRHDGRRKARSDLFMKIKGLMAPDALIKSDLNPHYPPEVKKHFPHLRHETTKGRRGYVTGQGELKAGGYDPLFSFNHTAAMLRANICRLFRRTWNTTKKTERLEFHIALYSLFHNMYLTK